LYSGYKIERFKYPYIVYPNMPRLFVRRDPLHLIPREGSVHIDGTIPENLSRQPLVADPKFLDLKLQWHDNELPIRPGQKDLILPEETGMLGTKGIPAVWSGYRSCVTLDETTNQLFKLKGIAFNQNPSVTRADGHIQILGGQFASNARYEGDSTRKFNKVLRKNGIEPVMDFAGYYEFPIQVDGQNLGTSIFRVKGDSRLDELFYMLEIIYSGQLEYSSTKKGKFEDHVKHLYSDIGFVIGKLKSVIDKNGLSWSTNPRRTNAHIGNVVVYRGDSKNLGLGIVDFDSTNDLTQVSADDLKRQQKAEYETILNSALLGGISYRNIGRNFRPSHIVGKFRKFFVDGFKKGYEASTEKVVNFISSGRFQEIVELLPEGFVEIVQEVYRPYFENLSIDKTNKNLYNLNYLSLLDINHVKKNPYLKIDNLSNIINKNDKYNKLLSYPKN